VNANPPQWRALEAALKAHPGSFVRLFWNGSGRCFTVRVEDDAGRWFPLDEGTHPLWATGKATAVGALDAVARIVRASTEPPQ
jgi:hypothetical protein